MPTKNVFALAMVSILFLDTTANAFDGTVHNRMTSAAIETFNYCLKQNKPEHQSKYEITGDALKSAIARKDQNEDGVFYNPASLATRYANWHFYNQSNMAEPWYLKRFLDRIFSRRITQLNDAISDGKPLPDQYIKAGSVMHYVQDASSPPHVAPVYHWKIGKLGIKEPFDGYQPVKKSYPDNQDLTQEQCQELLKGDVDLKVILKNDAEKTLAGLGQDITVRNDAGEHQYKWGDFWRTGNSTRKECPDKAVNKQVLGFGTYGQFCNKFGEERLQSGDGGYINIPAETYDDLFLQQFIQARNSSVKVLAWVMRNDLERQ